MVVLYFIGIVVIVAGFAAIVFAIGGRKKSRQRPEAIHLGSPDLNKEALDEEQAAVTASTWTSINPPS